jgi:hypothetical protein
MCHCVRDPRRFEETVAPSSSTSNSPSRIVLWYSVTPKETYILACSSGASIHLPNFWYTGTDSLVFENMFLFLHPVLSTVTINVLSCSDFTISSVMHLTTLAWKQTHLQLAVSLRNTFRFVSQSFPLLPTHSRCWGCFIFTWSHSYTHHSR